MTTTDVTPCDFKQYPHEILSHCSCHVYLNEENISVERDLQNINWNIDVHICHGDSVLAKRLF